MIEGAPTSGISIGWSAYMRDVSVTGNVVRNAQRGISVCRCPNSAGAAVISGNLISGAAKGAIVGMDHALPASDLEREGHRATPTWGQVGNRVR